MAFAGVIMTFAGVIMTFAGVICLRHLSVLITPYSYASYFIMEFIEAVIHWGNHIFQIGNRERTVVLENNSTYSSDWKDIKSFAVLQWTTFSAFFIVCMNDLQKAINSEWTVLADDKIAIIRIKICIKKININKSCELFISFWSRIGNESLVFL